MNNNISKLMHILYENKSVFSKKDKEGFEYALNLQDLTPSEMHIIMYLNGIQKHNNHYNKYDKLNVYRMLLDNIDNRTDMTRKEIVKRRNKKYEQEHQQDNTEYTYNDKDYTDMKTCSDELLKNDEVYF